MVHIVARGSMDVVSTARWREREYGPKAKCIDLHVVQVVTPLRSNSQLRSRYKANRHILQDEHEQCKLKSIFVVARKRLISFYNTNCKLCAIYWEFLLYRNFVFSPHLLSLFSLSRWNVQLVARPQHQESSAHATHMILKWENILSRSRSDTRKCWIGCLMALFTILRCSSLSAQLQHK